MCALFIFNNDINIINNDIFFLPPCQRCYQLDGYPAVTLFSFFLLSIERLLGLSRGINFKAYGDMHFIHVRCAIL